MSQAKHTPGPWRMWTSNSYRRISSEATGGDGDVLCAVVQPSDGHPDLHFKNGGFEGPDAMLMLAAPELLEALEDAAVELELCAWEDGVMVNARAEDAAKDVRAAIAKATRGVA